MFFPISVFPLFVFIYILNKCSALWEKHTKDILKENTESNVKIYHTCLSSIFVMNWSKLVNLSIKRWAQFISFAKIDFAWPNIQRIPGIWTNLTWLLNKAMRSVFEFEFSIKIQIESNFLRLLKTEFNIIISANSNFPHCLTIKG